MVDLSVTLAGHRLDNPVMIASGCGGSGRELNRFFDVATVGAVVTPSVMVESRSGGQAPLRESPSGLVTDLALPGPGAAGFADHDLAWLSSIGATVLTSVAGTTSTEYADVASTLLASEAFSCAMGVEVNLSCPSSTTPGMVFGEDALAAGKVVALVRERLPRHVALFAKLSPDATDLTSVAAACVRAGADGLTLVNGPTAMAFGGQRPRASEDSLLGRLSGPAIRPLAVHAVWQVRSAMFAGRLPTVPIIGVGGVRTGLDALELVAAGASAVQVGTAIFTDPSAPLRVREELAGLLQADGLGAFTDTIAAAHGR
jgi:dihydroorotate dehydrogenase (NAD+) catalytic subunit